MIYVDVDNTLVLYRDTEPVQHSGVLMGMGFLVNHELGACPRIRSWRRKPPRNNLLTAIWTLSWSN